MFATLFHSTTGYYFLSQPIQPHLSLFQHIPAYFSPFKHIPTYSIRVQPKSAHSSLVQHIQAYFSLLQPIPAQGATRKLAQDLRKKFTKWEHNVQLAIALDKGFPKRYDT